MIFTCDSQDLCAVYHLPVQSCPNCIKTTLNRDFPYQMLPGVSWATSA